MTPPFVDRKPLYGVLLVGASDPDNPDEAVNWTILPVFGPNDPILSADFTRGAGADLEELYIWTPKEGASPNALVTDRGAFVHTRSRRR